MAAVVLVGVMTAAAGGDGRSGYAQGRALAGTGNEIGNEHVRVGAAYWVTMPLQSNVTGEPLTVLRTRWVHVPHNVKVIRYGVVTVKETGGAVALGAVEPKYLPREVGPAHVGAERPVGVPAHSDAKAYVLSLVKVTGPVHDNLSGYRVRYRQGAVEYRQDLDWDVALRLHPEDG
ncbi:hypothetical protein [Streptomyces sp. NPDC004376]